MFEQTKVVDIGRLDYLALLELRARINEELSAQDSSALAKLNAGEHVPGFRLKKGHKSRKLTSEVNLVNILSKNIDKDALFTKKVIGIPAIEKLLLSQPNATKEKVALFLSDHVTTTVGVPSLEFVGV